MQRDIATTAAKIMTGAASVATEVKEGKSRLERGWRYFVTFVETFWGLCKKSMEKVEQLWLFIKSAVEHSWGAFWGELPNTDSNVDDALLRIPVDVDYGHHRRVGINIGLLYVDKKAYGTDASCPGCDHDAVALNRILRKCGFTTKLFLNNEATWYNIKTTLAKYASELESGDLLVITAAGHGGQVRDTNGDETDGLDETWLLYDKEVPDDEILETIKKFKSGVRIVLINDQCHSEGNFRSFVRGVQQAVSFGHWGKREGHPLVSEEGDGQVSVVEESGPSLIQFAGCRENNVSYGSSTGGEWTSALVSAFNPELSWREWFDKAARIPRKQAPQWVEYGPVTDAFRNGKVMQ